MSEEKTDWPFFFSTLSDECLQGIVDHAYRERMKREMAKCHDTLPPLNEEEIAMVKNDKYIGAIKTYRQRTRTDLVSAKTVVDIYKKGCNVWAKR